MPFRQQIYTGKVDLLCNVCGELIWMSRKSNPFMRRVSALKEPEAARRPDLPSRPRPRGRRQVEDHQRRYLLASYSRAGRRHQARGRDRNRPPTATGSTTATASSAGSGEARSRPPTCGSSPKTGSRVSTTRPNSTSLAYEHDALAVRDRGAPGRPPHQPLPQRGSAGRAGQPSQEKALLPRGDPTAPR